MRIRGWLLTTGILLGIGLAPGCRRESTAEGDRLILISPHWEGIQQEFTDGFRSWYRERTGRNVELDWIDQGGTTDDLKFVRSEFARRPEGINIDVFFGGGIDVFLKLAEDGLLETCRLPDALLDALPKELFGVPIYDPQYRWYGAVISGFGVMTNRVLMEREGLPEVRGWEDLARPEYFGKIAAADPRKSGSAHMIYEIILQSLGWEEGFRVLTCLGGNVRTFLSSSSEIPKMVSSGDSVLGLSIDFYAYNEIDAVGSDKIAYVIPEGAMLFNPDPIGILRGAPHPDVARAFVEFVMSEPGQKLWMFRKGAPGGPKAYALNRASVLPSLYAADPSLATVRVNPFELRSTVRYDNRKGAERTVLLNELFGALFITSHAQLQKAWRRVIEAGAPGEMIRELGRPPIGEEEALALAPQFERDPELRNRKIAEWNRFARRKYEAIAAR